MAVRTGQKLYISDLDGTLLGPSGTLSEYSRRELIRLTEAGVAFTAASARTWSEIRPLLDGVPLRLPVIAINGAFLCEFETGRPLIINELPPATVRRIYEMILRSKLRPFICAYDGRQEALYFQDLVNPEMRWFHSILAAEKQRRLGHVEDLARVLEYDVVSFALMGSYEPVHALYVAIEKDFAGQLENFFFENPYSPGHWWLTIHDRRSCKSLAMIELANLCGVKPEDVVVFGDHLNDIGMFRKAGRGVAVANAHEALKRIADEVIGSNEEDAVVRYVARDSGLTD